MSIPTGAIASANFTTNHYYAGGVEVVDPAALFGADTVVQTTFNAADISADGLAHASIPNFIGDFLADSINPAGRTFVFDFTVDGDGGFQFYLTTDFATFDPFYMFSAAQSGNSFVGSADPEVLAQQYVVQGINRAAVTMSPTHMAFSINGAATVSQSVAVPFDAIVNAAINDGGHQFLRSITVYPVQDDATLATMSAVA